MNVRTCKYRKLFSLVVIFDLGKSGIILVVFQHLKGSFPGLKNRFTFKFVYKFCCAGLIRDHTVSLTLSHSLFSPLSIIVTLPSDERQNVCHEH